METLADKLSEQKQAVKRLQELVGDLITGTDPEDRKENGRKAIDILQAMEEEADRNIEATRESHSLICDVKELLNDLYQAAEEGETVNDKREIMDRMDSDACSIIDYLEDNF